MGGGGGGGRGVNIYILSVKNTPTLSYMGIALMDNKIIGHMEIKLKFHFYLKVTITS